MTRRPCPTCRHDAPLLSGRCTAMSGAGICGCACPHTRTARASQAGPSDDQPVLAALAAGNTCAAEVAAYAGLDTQRARNVLRRLQHLGWTDSALESEATQLQGPKRRRYQLTKQGREALAGFEDALP